MRIATAWLIVAALAAAGATSAPATPVAPVAGSCDTANVIDIFGNLTGDKERAERIAIVQGRIVECARKINDFLAHAPSPQPSAYWLPPKPQPQPSPTQTPVCTNPPPATTASKEYRLYELLTMCVAYLTYLNALPTPEPTDTPPAIYASRPTFYVFATGAVDDAVANVLIRSVVERLAAARAHAGGPLAVVARAGWTDPDAFAAQCRFDPNTRGALIIETSARDARNANYLAVIAQFSDVDASIELLGCANDGASRNVPALSLVTEERLSGTAHETAMVTGTIAALAAALNVGKTTTSVTVANGRANVLTTTYNPIVLSGNLLTYFQNENLNVPAQNESVRTRVASARFTDAAMHRLGALCRDRELQLMASQADPARRPVAPPEHR
ncbi:MAG: hypothetical protein JOY59_08680, partial [Candidatus Eremiobacteraeota bacterium]|nr:hypothetical protein [Candidatus Eremiobacteraeota bacterium]